MGFYDITSYTASWILAKLLLLLMVASQPSCGVQLATDKYYFATPVVQSVVMNNKYLVGGLLAHIQIITLGQTLGKSVDLPRNLINGSYLYLSSVEKSASEDILVVGLSFGHFATFKINNGAAVFQQVAQLSTMTSTPVTSISRIGGSNKIIAVSGNVIFSFDPSELNNVEILTKIQNAIFRTPLISVVSSPDGKKLLLISNDRLAAFLVDRVTNQLDYVFRASELSQLPGEAGRAFVDAKFLTTTTDVQLVSLLLREGTVVTFEYSVGQYYQIKNYPEASDARSICQIVDTDFVVVGFRDAFFVANILHPTNINKIAYSVLKSIIPGVKGNNFLVNQGFEVVELQTSDVCVSGCLECALKNGEKVCLNCIPNLKLSTDSKSCITTCTTPTKPFVALTGCANICPSGTWEYSFSCEQCDADCENCYGPNPNRCTSCKNAKRLSKTGNCDSNCPDYQFYDESQGICDWCTPNCQICKSKEGCDACKPGYVVNQKTMTCSPKCPEGQYLDQYLGIGCRNCTKGCAVCRDESPSTCSRCKSSHILFIDAGIISCRTMCPPGTFKNEDLQSCQRCDPSCLECMSQDVCTKCVDGYYRLTQDNSCVKECSQDKGLYIQDEKYCNACRFPCKTCTQDTCLSCASGYELKVGSCWKKSDWEKTLIIVIMVVVVAVVSTGLFIFFLIKKKVFKGMHSNKPERKHDYQLTNLEREAQDASRVSDNSFS